MATALVQNVSTTREMVNDNLVIAFHRASSKLSFQRGSIFYFHRHTKSAMSSRDKKRKVAATASLVILLSHKFEKYKVKFHCYYIYRFKKTRSRNAL